MRISDWSSDVCSSDLDEEADVQAYDAVDFPLAIGREALVVTEFSTQIVSSPSGHEQRASEWAEARMRYDAGPGLRSAADVRALTDLERKSVVQGKSVSGLVTIGGRRFLKQKKES